MNERIQELTAQAGIKLPDDSEYNGHIYRNSIEKFARLIVQECVDVLDKRFMGDLNREDMEVRRCIEDVKRHFGIEQ